MSSLAKYKTYPEYKDSGVEWLGEIPSGWEIVRIGRLFSRLKRTGFANKKLLSVYRDYGVIPKSSRDDNHNKPSDDLTQYQLVKPNDLVMNKMKTWQGSIAISEFEGIVSPAYFVYQPLKQMFNKAFPKYIHYLLRNPRYVSQYLRRSKGIRINQWDLDPNEFQNIELLLPSKVEQNLIFKFLDHETAKIDQLIEKQQKLIELLKEKSQAVISHAVTKGLDPNIKMKDSGVEWLGDVPEHWDVTKLKYLVKLSSEKIYNSSLRYLGMENIESKTGNYIETEGIFPEGVSSKFNKDNVLFGKLRPYLAKVWLAEFSGICSSEFLVLETNSILNTYLKYFLLSNEVIKEVDASTYGSKMPRANWEFIGELPVPNISYEEAATIVQFIESQLNIINQLTQKAEQQIELMKERRTALISAAVTGKIDVRDWQAENEKITV